MREEYLIRIHGVMEQDDDRDSVELMTRGSFVCGRAASILPIKKQRPPATKAAPPWCG